MSDLVKRRLDYTSPSFLIPSVDLTVHLHDQKTLVTSALKVVRNGDNDAPLILDGQNIELVSAKIHDAPVHHYKLTDEQLVITDVPDEFELVIVTRLDPSQNKALEGLYLSNGVFCTQCEAEGFRRITYFIDRPDILSVYTVTVIGDRASLPTLLSNGNAIARGDDGDEHWVTWHDPHPKPCYLFALVAGEFDRLDDSFTTCSGRDVKLELFVDKGMKDKGVFALESLKRAMAWDEQVYGLEYDLDIYMVVAVDFFNMGAMENKGLNIFNSKFVLADQASATDEDFFHIESVIAHEYFHNWSGNRVTCRDWFQLSLKEGLTVFRDQQFSADMTSPLSTRISQVRVMREHQFAEDASAMSHPIRPDEVMEMNNFYTVTVYDKGAEVIRMMHTLLGSETYRKGMDVYFERHDGQAVTCDDFVAAMQSVTDIDLSQFALWYSQSGTPCVKVEREWDVTSGKATLTLHQHTPSTADQKQKQNLHIPVGIYCLNENGEILKDDHGKIQDNMIQLCESKIELSFSECNQQPVPVLLANFSAPVRLENPLTPHELLAIFNSAPDNFNRWDAIQQLYDLCIATIEAEGIDAIDEQIWTGLSSALLKERDNHELLGECLVIPSFETLCQSRKDIVPAALLKARDVFCRTLCEKLHDELVSIYNSISNDTYQYEQSAIQGRRCKNQVLKLLAVDTTCAQRIEAHFNAADNMTDKLGALKAAQLCDLSLFDNLMSRFEQDWREDALVMDKWFGLQATTHRTDILSQVQLVQEHPAFKGDNPNRVRALLGSFAFYNTSGFHEPSGAGYRYVTDYLIKLDKANPQVASRIVTPLTQWQRFSAEHQELMKGQLSRLLSQSDLSKDLFEKVSKSLSYEHKSE